MPADPGGGGRCIVISRPLADRSGDRRLELARDHEQMAEVFRRKLRPLEGPAWEVKECRLLGVKGERNWPGLRRWVLCYGLRIVEPKTGSLRAHWATGVIYPGGRIRRTWSRLSKSWLREELGLRRSGRRLKRSLPTTEDHPSYPSVFRASEPEMLVWVFPLDLRMPAAARLVAGPPPEVEEVLVDRYGHGEWRLEEWRAEPRRYAAGVRATFRLTFNAVSGETGLVTSESVYAKVFAEDERGESVFRTLETLSARAKDGRDEFVVGRPIAYLPGLRTLLQEEVPGEPLGTEVLVRESDPAPTMRRVARALVSLHLDQLPTPRRRVVRKTVSDGNRWGLELQRTCPHLRSAVGELMAEVAHLEEVAQPSPIHGDFGLDHVLCDEEFLGLLDLDQFAAGDPVLDVGFALSELALTPIVGRLPEERARAAAEAFADEYFAHVPDAWRGRLPRHYAASLLEKALITSRRREPGWSERVDRLIEEARVAVASPTADDERLASSGPDRAGRET